MTCCFETFPGTSLYSQQEGGHTGTESSTDSHNPWLLQARLKRRIYKSDLASRPFPQGRSQSEGPPRPGARWAAAHRGPAVRHPEGNTEQTHMPQIKPRHGNVLFQLTRSNIFHGAFWRNFCLKFCRRCT